MTIKRAVATGYGSYLPERVVTNEELARQVDTSNEWIIERTGIKERRIAADNEYTSDLAIAASRAALKSAGLEGNDLDYIILATTTADHTFPATATQVQEAIGMTRGAAFDLQAVCSGFIYALGSADTYIRAGEAKRILVIGAETFSRLVDWSDRSTCVLFGDGAGALVLEAQDGAGTPDDRGIIATCIHSDGRMKDLLYANGGPSTSERVGVIQMKGREVFRHAVVNLSDVVFEVLGKAGLQPADVDWIVPHQANRRIIDGTARKLGIDPGKIIVTVDHHGNTSAASVPLALCEAVDNGQIKDGDLILMEAMGGGFTWGATLLRW